MIFVLAAFVLISAWHLPCRSLAAIPLQLSLSHPAPESNGGFGRAVAATDNRIFVGALTTDLGANGSGAAYLFDRQSGDLLRTLADPEPRSNALFGTAVAMFGDDLLVSTLSTTTEGPKPGRAYLFDGVTGNLLHTFTSPTPTTEDSFGFKVASSGELIAVSAILDDSQASNSGVVHLYNGTTGTHLRTLSNPHPRAEDRFGIDLAFNDNNLVVGSTGGETGTGAAYVFDPSNGGVIFEFHNPTPSTGDNFGRAVATTGDEILVGAPRDDTLGLDVGMVYRFATADGGYLGEIQNPAPVIRGAFGSDIAVSDSSIGIGAPVQNTVFVFDRLGNDYLDVITPPPPHSNGLFGEVVIGHSRDLIVGHGLDDIGSQDAGSVLVFSVPETSTLCLVFAAMATLGMFRRELV